MSNDYSTLSGATAPAIGNSVALRIFPAEKPTFKDLRQWLEHGEMVLNQTIYGPALRGETPTHLAHLQVKRDNGITLLTTAQRSAVGPLELARYDQGVAKAIQDEQIRLRTARRGHSRVPEQVGCTVAIGIAAQSWFVAQEADVCA